MRSTLLFFTLLGLSQLASAQHLNSYKDRAFAHGRVLQTANKQSFKRIDYNETRDINGQDLNDENGNTRYIARPERVELLPNQYEVTTSIRGVRVHQAGPIRGSDFAVIFIHGAGGTRDLGFDDWTFGGNFNRLKHLSLRNHGVYFSPSARLNSRGARSIGKMIQELKSKSRNMKFVLACGSRGGEICWELAKSPEYSKLLSGLIFLGTAENMPRGRVPYITDQKPIIFAHGSSDTVLPWEHLKQSFDQIKTSYPSYPIKYFLYNNGSHGTPIRMIDWRESLNWIFKN